MLQLVAQLGHVHAQVVRVLDRVRTPHLLQELAMGEDLARMTDEGDEQLVFGGGEMYLLARHEHLPGGEVHRDIARDKYRFRGLTGPRVMAQRHPEARE